MTNLSRFVFFIVSGNESPLTATKLIALRTLVAIVAVAIFPYSEALAATTLVLFLFVVLIDMFDGILADYKGHVKPFGGFLDIAADQCIEGLFWLLFLKHDLVPLWIPAFILTRNSFINLLRVDAIAAGRTMFGSHGMLQSRFAQLLVGARFSRGLMVLAKTVGFAAAILLHIAQTYGPADLEQLKLDPHSLHVIVITSLTTLAGIHLLRGIVITVEARSSFGAFLWNAPASQGAQPAGEE